MRDTCVFCGDDVSDLSSHMCKGCIDNLQIDLLSNKSLEYQRKRDRAQKHKTVCEERLTDLPWYRIVQRRYLRKMLHTYIELIAEYTEIIDLLEMEMKYRRTYKPIGGNTKLYDV